MELPDVKEKFRLTQVCTEPDFILSTDAESKDDQRRSKINPLYLTVRAKYKNGEVMCNVKISDVYLVWQGFSEKMCIRDRTKCWLGVISAAAGIRIFKTVF